MKRKNLTGLQAHSYEHPFDKKALKSLKNTPGLEFATKKFFEYGVEQILQVQYTGSGIKVTPNNFPKLYKLFNETCHVLSMDYHPDLYLSQGFVLNAYATGVKKPLIVLNHVTVDIMDEEELLFILGHELGHVKSKHVLYLQMARVLPYLGQLIGSFTFGLGEVVSEGILLALLHWQRMAEFTCDRAGLLACQDEKKAINALIKLAGLPAKYYDQDIQEDFIKQAKEFESLDFEHLKRITKFLMTVRNTHPWIVLRSSEILKWMESGAYQAILESNDRIKETIVQNNEGHCTVCGAFLEKDHLYCGVCGTKIIRHET